MSKQQEKIYYSYLNVEADKRTKETFIDPSDYKWSALIENNYQVIRDEVLQHFSANEKYFHPYFANELINTPGKWKSFGFYFWGIKAKKTICDDFPITINLLKRIPGIVSASVSVMEPDSEIKPHFGDTNAIHRCHLGLIIPGQLPETGFQVAYEKRSWQQGKLLIFNDGAYHKAWNHTSQRRIVLIFDVIRPEFLNRKSWICARVNTIILTQRIGKGKSILQNFAKQIFIQWVMSLGMFLYMQLFKRNHLWL